MNPPFHSVAHIFTYIYIYIYIYIYGPTYSRKYWRIEMNKEIYNEFQSTDILPVMKVQSLEQLGPVVRMDA